MKRLIPILGLSILWVGITGVATSPSNPQKGSARPNFAPPIFAPPDSAPQGVQASQVESAVTGSRRPLASLHRR